MNNNIIKGMIGLSIVLLLVLLIEWLLIDTSEQALNQSAPQQQASSLTQLPKLSVATQAIESYAAMVEQPLFIEGRKPIVGNEELIEDIESVGEIKDLTLQGIYSIEGKKIALFSKKGVGKNFLKKSEGEDVNGWLLKEIKADRVVLDGDGSEQTVMLRKPKPKQLKKARLAKRKAKRPRIKPKKQQK